MLPKPQNKIDRWHIRNQKFEEYFLEWDGDWEVSNLNQNLAIYEDDTRGDIEYTGSIKTTVKDPTSGNSVEGNIGYKRKVHSDDQIITQKNLNHQSFFPLNRTNIENQMKNGWPVRDVNATVSFTLQDRTFRL